MKSIFLSHLCNGCWCAKGFQECWKGEMIFTDSHTPFSHCSRLLLNLLKHTSFVGVQGTRKSAKKQKQKPLSLTSTNNFAGSKAVISKTLDFTLNLRLLQAGNVLYHEMSANVARPLEDHIYLCISSVLANHFFFLSVSQYWGRE